MVALFEPGRSVGGTKLCGNAKPPYGRLTASWKLRLELLWGAGMAGTRGWSPNVYTIYELCVAPRCPDSRNRRYQFLLNIEQVGLAPLGGESNDLFFRARLLSAC